MLMWYTINMEKAKEKRHNVCLFLTGWIPPKDARLTGWFRNAPPLLLFQLTLGILSKCDCILRRCVIDLMAVWDTASLRPPLPLYYFGVSSHHLRVGGIHAYFAKIQHSHFSFVLYYLHFVFHDILLSVYEIILYQRLTFFIGYDICCRR